MSDLHEFHVRLAHGWGAEEAKYFQNPGTANYKKEPERTAPRFKPANNFTTEPVIPDPSLFQSLSAPQGDVTDLPSVSQCGAHLELLEAIYNLRWEVVNTTRLDEALGLPAASKKVWRKTLLRVRWGFTPHDILDPAYPEKAEEKWNLFLSAAVLRFELWAAWSNELMRESGVMDLPHLPPLDILAVWHALMLNPGDYIMFCKHQELDSLILAPFPWDRIHEAIQSESASVKYEISQADADWFKDATKQPASLFKAIEGTERDAKSPVSEAVTAWAEEDRSGPNGVETVLAYLDKDDEDYAFVSLLSEAREGVDRVQPMMQNVIRQGSFVDKMHTHLWLRSPAVEGTLRRAIDRYDKFTQLFRDYPRHTLVPTLDMDLVWHTHQLSHARYRAGMTAITGRFIGHDDTIGQGTLDVQGNNTQRLFEDVFDEEYGRCMCWDCEAVFSAAEADDEMSVEGDDWVEGLAANVRGDLQYYRAAEMVRRKGWPETQDRVQPLPTRRQASSGAVSG